MYVLVFDFDDTLCPTTRIQQGEVDDVSRLQTRAGALEVLTLPDTTNILLSYARFSAEHQHRKIDTVGLHDYFDAIHIVDTCEGKRAVYRQVVEQSPDAQHVGIGDRVDTDIRYANELGMTTIRLRRGKYKDIEATHPDEEPDYTVTTLGEIPGILEHI